MPDQAVDLGGLSDGELLELAMPSESLNRRVLVMWLYLKGRSGETLEEFDLHIGSLAEKELQRRAISQSVSLQ